MKPISQYLLLIIALVLVSGCRSLERQAEYPQDLTRAEVALIQTGLLHEQSDSVLVQWASLHPEELAVWGCLQQSMEEGGVTPEQADRLVELVIAYTGGLDADRQRGLSGPRGDILALIERRDGLSRDQFKRLAIALHGDAFTIKAGQHNADYWQNFSVEYGSPFSLPFKTNLPYQVFWQVTEVKIDGKRVPIVNPHFHPQMQTFRVEGPELTPGDHRVEVDVAIGIGNWRDFYRLSRQALEVKDWPEMRARWEMTGQSSFQIKPRQAAEAN